MHPNPVLRRLGLSTTDRVAIIHADDIGMCQATLTAFADLLDFGLVSCGAAMVPCPWFPSVVAYARNHPGADIGVHLTLNCEYSTYRWGPISTRDPAAGMQDTDGCFYRRPADTQLYGDPAAVRAELLAQVVHALASGIDVSHIDTHMGTVAHHKFMSGYVAAAADHRLPLMVMRRTASEWQAMGMNDATATVAAHTMQQLEEAGVPLVDHIFGMPLDQPEDRVTRAKAAFDALPAGITHFVLHPAADTPELRAIATSDWPSRVGDYHTFTSEELARHVRARGVQVIGYRALRDLLRGAA